MKKNTRYITHNNRSEADIIHNNKMFIEDSKNKYGKVFKYDKTKYTGMRNPITITCRFHGDFTITQAQSHISSLSSGCPECGKMHKLTPFKFYDIIKNLDCGFSFNKTVYYKKEQCFCKGLVTATCNTHGDFQTTPFNLIEGKGCKQCDTNRYTQEFIQQAKKIHPEYSFINTRKHTTNQRERIVITCNKHGDFTTTSKNFLKKEFKCNPCILLDKRKEQEQILNNQRIEKIKLNKLEIKQVLANIKLKYPKTLFSYNEDDVTHLTINQVKIKGTCTVHNYSFNSSLIQLVNSNPYKGCSMSCTQCRTTNANSKSGHRINKDKIITNLKPFTHMKYSLLQHKSKVHLCILDCYCKIHDLHFQNNLNNIMKTKFGGCGECFNEWRKQPKKTRKQFPKYTPKKRHLKRQKPKFTTEEFIQKCRDEWENPELLENYDFSNTVYKTMNKPISITCKEHGQWSPKASNFIRGHGCHFCGNKTRVKKYEAKFVEELQIIGLYNTVDYNTQYRIKCPNRNYFIDFCFGFNDTLLFIEIDEAHHNNYESQTYDNKRDIDIMAQYPNCTIIRVDYMNLQYGIDAVTKFFNWD